MPQITLQFWFALSLMGSKNIKNNETLYLLILSIILSLISIASTLTKMDDLGFIHIEYSNKWLQKWTTKQFYIRLFFRLNEVFGKITIFILIWLVLGMFIYFKH